jgi:hypothetical protein
MLRGLLLSAALLAFSSSLASADTFPILDKNPVATVSVPAAWKPHAYEGGVEGASADGKVYVAVEVVDGPNVGETAKEGLKWFADQGVKIDENSLKSTEIKVNGMKALDNEFTGVDKLGPAKMSMTLIVTNKPSKFLLVYYWGDDASEKANMKDLAAIAASIQATK